MSTLFTFGGVFVYTFVFAMFILRRPIRLLSSDSSYSICCSSCVVSVHRNISSAKHTGVVQLSLQADGKVAIEDIPVFGVCRPACHDSSLYLFVLVLFLEAVVLCQVHVALDIFYEHIVHVWRGVCLHLCLCDVHLKKTHSTTFIG